MSLSLDVANDLAEEGALSASQWEQIRQELARRPREYSELLSYWSLGEEPLEDCFALTRLIRQLEVTEQ
jgi:hypothetical protein